MISVGIRPQTALARAAGLVVERGIVVDDTLTTSDPRVLAVGECAQHRGVVHGIVAPIHEQAKVAAATLCGEAEAYTGSIPTAKLKVMGVDLVCAGNPDGARAVVVNDDRTLPQAGGRRIGAHGRHDPARRHPRRRAADGRRADGARGERPARAARRGLAGHRRATSPTAPACATATASARARSSTPSARAGSARRSRWSTSPAPARAAARASRWSASCWRSSAAARPRRRRSCARAGARRARSWRRSCASAASSPSAS